MREPHFWSAGLDPKSREAAPLTRLLLTPLAWLYATITRLKIKNTTPMQVDAYVICIGNLTAGGVGKSPVVAKLRDHIAETSGLRCATLSRGYKGRLKGPLRVDPNAQTAADVGDEPLMLAQSGESWIGADRAAAGQAMSNAGVNVILMDDGHQNPTLAKDLSLIVVDSETRFGNGHIIPKGPLREPISEGLARAHGIILTGSGETPPELAEITLPVFRATLSPKQAPPEGPLVAFAGIGRPEKMFESLRAAGADLRDAVPFPDHHTYTRSDLTYLRRLATDHDAQLITTEKDYARLDPGDRPNIKTFPVEIQFDDMVSLDNLLAPVLKPAK